MGQIAEDIIQGACCQYCGVYFTEQHGYPVSCDDCHEGEDLQSIHPEL